MHYAFTNSSAWRSPNISLHTGIPVTHVLSLAICPCVDTSPREVRSHEQAAPSPCWKNAPTVTSEALLLPFFSPPLRRPCSHCSRGMSHSIHSQLLTIIILFSLLGGGTSRKCLICGRDTSGCQPIVTRTCNLTSFHDVVTAKRVSARAHTRDSTHLRRVRMKNERRN